MKLMANFYQVYLCHLGRRRKVDRSPWGDCSRVVGRTASDLPASTASWRRNSWTCGSLLGRSRRSGETRSSSPSAVRCTWQPCTCPSLCCDTSAPRSLWWWGGGGPASGTWRSLWRHRKLPSLQSCSRRCPSSWGQGASRTNWTCCWSRRKTSRLQIKHKHPETPYDMFYHRGRFQPITDSLQTINRVAELKFPMATHDKLSGFTE